MNDGAHLAGLQQALRGLLPEDFPPDVPIYAVSEWDAGRRFACGPSVRGFTGIALDLHLQGHLQRVDRWRGRGFAFVLMEGEPRSGEAQLNTALHEAAHWLGWEPSEPEDAAAAPPPDSDLPVYFFQNVVEPALDAAAGRHWPPWRGHDAGFVRAGLHVMVRAQRRGFDCSAESLNLGHGLADPFAYLLALDGEPERRIGEPLRDVLRDEPPERFAEFARRDREDKARWWADVAPDWTRALREIRDGLPPTLTSLTPTSLTALARGIAAYGRLPARSSDDEQAKPEVCDA